MDAIPSGQRFWAYLILTISLITAIEILFVVIFDREVSACCYPVFVLDLLQVVNIFVFSERRPDK
jgi:hypothetical protein